MRHTSLQTRIQRILGLHFTPKFVFNNIVNTNLCELFVGNNVHVFSVFMFSYTYFLLAQEPVLNVLATCCYSLQRVIELMDTSGFILSVAKASEACESLQTHLKTYMWLAWYSYSRCLLLFKVRCKTHYNFHVADDIKATRLNPAVPKF